VRECKVQSTQPHGKQTGPGNIVAEIPAKNATAQTVFGLLRKPTTGGAQRCEFRLGFHSADMVFSWSGKRGTPAVVAARIFSNGVSGKPWLDVGQMGVRKSWSPQRHLRPSWLVRKVCFSRLLMPADSWSLRILLRNIGPCITPDGLTIPATQTEACKRRGPFMWLHFASLPSNHGGPTAAHDPKSESWGQINVGGLRGCGTLKRTRTVSHASDGELLGQGCR